MSSFGINASTKEPLTLKDLQHTCHIDPLWLQECNQLTPEGKKVATRGRGKSDKKDKTDKAGFLVDQKPQR